MTQEIPYWHVDAFADRPFAGNQAAVMLFEAWPDEAVLQAIGAENQFAETAFLVPDPSGAADRELRWFTPTSEVRLCGHATLASGHVLLSLMPDREAVTFATRHAGVLEVRRQRDAAAGYELALPAIPTEPGAWADAVGALGAAASPQEVRLSPDGYAVFLFDRAEDVIGLAPDFRAMAALGPWTMIASAPGRDTDVLSRVFVPAYGIDEDSVTGAAHAVLTPIWTERLGSERFSAYQASARGGYLDCRLDGKRAVLGGRCATVVEGRFFL